jgi:hypothetical protein
MSIGSRLWNIFFVLVFRIQKNCILSYVCVKLNFICFKIKYITEQYLICSVLWNLSRVTNQNIPPLILLNIILLTQLCCLQERKLRWGNWFALLSLYSSRWRHTSLWLYRMQHWQWNHKSDPLESRLRIAKLNLYYFRFKFRLNIKLNCF